MTDIQLIRRYLYIGDEARFLNSNKKFVYVSINISDLRKIRISLSNKKNVLGYDLVFNREEFKDILENTEWYKDSISTTI